MNEIKVPVETLNAVLAYLGARPYQEVFNLIQAVQNAAKEQLTPTSGDGDVKEVDSGSN